MENKDEDFTDVPLQVNQDVRRQIRLVRYQVLGSSVVVMMMGFLV